MPIVSRNSKFESSKFEIKKVTSVPVTVSKLANRNVGLSEVKQTEIGGI